MPGRCVCTHKSLGSTLRGFDWQHLTPVIDNWRLSNILTEYESVASLFVERTGNDMPSLVLTNYHKMKRVGDFPT